MCARARQADGSRELEYRAGEEEPKQAPGAEPKQAPPGKTPEPNPGEAGLDEEAVEDEEGAGDGQVNEAEGEQFEDRSFAAPQVRFGVLSCAFDSDARGNAWDPCDATCVLERVSSERLCSWPTRSAAPLQG